MFSKVIALGFASSLALATVASAQELTPLTADDAVVSSQAGLLLGGLGVGGTIAVTTAVIVGLGAATGAFGGSDESDEGPRTTSQ